MSDRQESELWFERYARETGHAGWDDHEPDLGTQAKPDYLVSKGPHRAVCEVKEYTTSRLQRRLEVVGTRPFSAPGNLTHISPGRKVRDGVKQLAELADRGLPLAVVLANPRGIILGAGLREVGASLSRHAHLSAVAILSIRQARQDVVDEWRRDRAPILRAQHEDTRELAMAMLDELDALDAPDEDYMRVDVLHTPAAQAGTAVRLSRELFNGPHDRHWQRNADGHWAPLD
jgi:hypothetical protein